MGCGNLDNPKREGCPHCHNPDYDDGRSLSSSWTTKPLLLDQTQIASAWPFFSRILDGLAGSNFSLARACIADIIAEENRAKGLVPIGVAFATAFITGLALGGILSNWPYATQIVQSAGLCRYSVPAFGALLLSIPHFTGVRLWLPEPLTPERKASLAHKKRTIHPVAHLRKALREPPVGPLPQSRFLYRLAFTMFTASFALFTRYRFGLSDETTSYILTYVGVLAVGQGFSVGRLADRCQERKIIVVGSGVLAIALLGWAVVPTVPLMLAVLTLLPMSGVD